TLLLTDYRKRNSDGGRLFQRVAFYPAGVSRKSAHRTGRESLPSLPSELRTAWTCLPHPALQMLSIRPAGNRRRIAKDELIAFL
ncbi:MAG: hypothetical protein ABI476_09875, partial [Oxalobacteraceae bacterium]